MSDKETLMDRLDIDEEEYQVLKENGLLPDNSEDSESWKKFNELMEKGGPFEFDELQFLGEMDLISFQKKYPAEAEKYMDL